MSVALLYSFIFFLFFRIIMIIVPYEQAKNALSLFWSGFFGLIIFLPIVYFSPEKAYIFQIPVLFAFTCFLGLLGCFIFEASPLHFSRKKIKKQKKSNPSSAPLPSTNHNESQQTIEESTALIERELQRLRSPATFFVRKKYSNKEGENFDFPFLALCPSGFFHIYPCNWIGDVDFSNSGAVRANPTRLDSKDYTLLITSQNRVLAELFDGNGLSIPITSIICCTNPNISFDFAKANNYKVLQVQHLAEFLSDNSTRNISDIDLYDAKVTIENIFS